MRIAIALSLLLAPVQDSAWKRDQKDVRIPMRDGKSLLADVYLPSTEGRYPTVLIQTPYSKDRMDTPFARPDEEAGEVGRGSQSDLKAFMDRDHYAYVIADWRGFYKSKAAMEGVTRGKWKRGQDGFDTVEWIASQPWSDGKVGTWGGSALGKQQFDTAAEQPPHLVCAAPLIAHMGQDYESYYEGGVYREAHVKMLDALGYGVSAMALKNPKGDTVLWRSVRRLTYLPEKIQVPCLMISGWWDHFPDPLLENFEDLVAKGGRGARDSKLLMGPWDHVSIGIARQGDLDFSKAALASAEAARAFFDHHLRGVDNGWEKAPRVRYWQSGEDGWREAESWPSIPRDRRVLRLHADGRLAEGEPEPGARTFRHDPKSPSPTLGGANLPPLKHGPTDHSALDRRKDHAAYETGALEAPIRLNGKAELKLSVSGSRSTFDVAVRICEVADGKPVLVAETIRRVRDAEPGKSVDVALSVPTTAYTFAKGRSLRAYVSAANWPRYERNPHTGADHWDAGSALDLELTVHGGTLTLPVLSE